VRIGVFGGTFDPPHVGHLILAADAVDVLRLDKLIFVPARAQPLKVNQPAIANCEQRVEMVRLAVGNESRYAVDDTEIAREGLSFTVDTLETLTVRFKGAELFLLLGEDAFSTFDRWKDPKRVRELATVAVMRRVGSKGSGRSSPTKTKGVETISTRQIDVSSTEIRKRLREGKSVRGFVPESVENFIRDRGLYR
jgi:nicotinate-nucleotide adenylyltransferase